MSLRALGLLLLILPSLLGCDAITQARKAARDQTLKNNLKTLGLVYHLHHEDHKVGPSSWEEAMTFANEQGLDAAAIQAAKDAGYEVKGGMEFKDVTDGLSNTPLSTNASGGPVLLFDGSVQ